MKPFCYMSETYEVALFDGPQPAEYADMFPVYRNPAPAVEKVEPVAEVVDAGGELHLPKLQWKSANHSFETPIGSQLYTTPQPAPADVIRQAKAQALRDAAEHCDDYNAYRLRRMAEGLNRE